MMEEIHSIFALGAGAVSKMVDYQPVNGGKAHIERLFYPKYPYEYLAEKEKGSARREEMTSKITEFYKTHKEVLNGIIDETR